ncbi:hypothetical protein [Kaistella daneshvariae]|nr:hypothetical protein [Kaistella daneshvariae]
MKKVTFKVGRTTLSIEMPKAAKHNAEIKAMGYTNFEIIEIYYD